MKFKCLLLVINSLFITSFTEAATDYNGPITGPKSFQNNDTVTSSTNYGISDTTNSGSGIQVDGAIKVNVTNAATSPITTAVNLVNGTTNNLGSSTIEATTTNQVAGSNNNPTLNGIIVSGAGTKINANGLQVTTKGVNNATGINLSGGASADLGSNSIIDASSSSALTGDSVYGIMLKSSDLTANNISITAGQPNATVLTSVVGLRQEGGTVNLTGYNTIKVTNGAGIATYGGNLKTDRVDITLTNLNASATGTATAGVITGRNTTVDLGNGSTIQASGDRTYGLLMSGGGSTFTANNLTVNIDSSRADAGGGIIESSNANNKITIKGATLSNNSDNGIHFANYSKDGTSYLNLENALVDSSGMTANFYGDVKVNLKNVTINNHNTFGFNAVALSASSSAEVKAENVSINLEKYRAYAVTASSGAKIIFTGNTSIDASKGLGAMNAYADSDQGQIITGEGGSKMNILGSLTSTNNGLIDLTMNAGSYLKGTTQAETGTINLAMTDSLWDMSDNSTVSDLKLNNSQVNFTKSTYSQLTVNNLSGSGLFTMKTDIAGQQGDLLKVTGTTEGSHKITVTNNGSANVNGSETLTLVETADGGGKFSLTNAVELGGYTYNLSRAQSNANNWELSTRKQLTSTANAATNFLNTTYLLNYIDNQTLLQRLGDLRNSPLADGETNTWIRSFGGKLNSFSGSQLDGFDMAYWGTQAGIDKQLKLPNGSFVVGAMLGLTKGNPNYQAGDGDSKNYSLGLYASYLANNGFYIDNVLKYNNTRNHFSVTDTAGNRVSGTGKTQGYSLSTELGKRFWLTNATNGFYLEPQAQLSYSYQNGDTVHASNGLKVGLSHYDSTLARSSLVTGYQIQGDNPINVYFKTGYIREMSGGTSYKLNNSKEDHNFRGGWWDNGIGINATINKNHHIYSDINYAKGSRFDQRQINLGYRYTF